MNVEPTTPSGPAAGTTAGPWAYRRLWLPDLLGVLALMVVAAVVFSRTDLDLRITRHFYFPDQPRPFWLHLRFPWKFFYDFVGVPVLLLVLGAMGLLVRAYRSPHGAVRRVHAIFLLLALGVGPGLVVNVGLKDHWGRPRPRHVHEFGGHWDYRQALDPGVGGKGKSFPCGHSSSGFVFAAFYFLFRRRRRRLGWLILAASVVYGLVLGGGRVLSGSHFASDVAWSGLIVFLVSLLLYYFGLNVPGREDAAAAGAPLPPPGRFALWGWAAVAVAIFVAAALATPYYIDILYAIPLPPGLAKPADVELSLWRSDVDLVFNNRDAVSVEGIADGFGLFSSRIVRRVAVTNVAGQCRARYALTREGCFTELNMPLAVYAPTTALARISVRVEEGDVTVRAPAGFVPPLEFRLGAGTLTLPAAWSNAPLRIAAPAGAVRYRDLPLPKGRGPRALSAADEKMGDE